ncbi:flagellar motor switch protein FliM [Enterococcus bulliens]
MDQVLTQQEIDLLLHAMNNGEIDQAASKIEPEKPKVKSYDFRRPTKLSKEYINTLHMIFEDFSKVSSSALSTLLRTNVTFQLAAIEQISYEEFIHSIPKFTLLGLFRSAPLNGLQMIEMNPQLSMLLVELLCGGLEIRQVTKEPFSDVEKKSFTDIELAILEEVMTRFATIFQTAWKEIVDLQTTVEGLDTNPQLMQNMSPNEPVVLTTFTVRMFETNSFINLCIPYVFFEGLTDKLSFRNWFDSNQAPSLEDQEELQRSMDHVAFDLEVILGNAHMTLADFLNLEEGDVLKLDQRISSPLASYVENKPYYFAKPGQHNKQLAVELLDPMEGEMFI